MNHSKLVKFPNQAQRLKQLEQQANNYFDASKWSKALPIYQEIFDAKPSYMLGVVIAECQLQLHRVQDAQHFLTQYQDQLLADGYDYTFFYIHVLLLDHRFIQARVATAALKSQRLVRVSQLELQIAEQSAVANEQEISKRIKTSYDLVNADSNQSETILNGLKQLPLVAYLKVLQIICDNPFIHPLYKNELLNFIVPLHLQHNIKLNWFQQTKTVNLAQLPATYKTEMLHSVQKLLTASVTDPALKQSLQEELNLEFLLLYPFADEVVTDAQTWLAGLLEVIQAPQSHKKADAATLKWHRQLMTLIEDLMV